MMTVEITSHTVTHSMRISGAPIVEYWYRGLRFRIEPYSVSVIVDDMLVCVEAFGMRVKRNGEFYQNSETGFRTWLKSRGDFESMPEWLTALLRDEGLGGLL
jgi:hypothetical protein